MKYLTKLPIVLAMLLILTALPTSPPAAAPAEEPFDPDLWLLKQHKVGTDDASLLEFLRKRSDFDDDLLNLDRLIRQLGDDKAGKRDEASRKLTAIGLAALPALRAALKNADPEIARRARTCVEVVAKETTWVLPAAAIRALLKRQSQGGAATLLQYVPYTGTDQATEEEIWFGLYKWAKSDAQILALLEKALPDRFVTRRALAACILGRLGDENSKKRVQQLLVDPDSLVRLRAAQGLLAGKDATGIAVLIDLLTEPSIDIPLQAEELLHYVAGEDAPEETLAFERPQQKVVVQRAWQKWWASGPVLDLIAIDKQPRRPGLVFVGGYGQSDNKKKLLFGICGCSGRIRWLVNKQTDASTMSVYSLQALAGGRFLTGFTLMGGPAGGAFPIKSSFVEQELTGKVIWEHHAPEGAVGPFATRLANGNTLIADYASVKELSPFHDLAFSFVRGDPDRRRLSRLFDGWGVQKTAWGTLCSLDRPFKTKKLTIEECDPSDGRELNTTVLDDPGDAETSQLKTLPSQNWLVVGLFVVLEADRRGHVLRSWQLQRISDAQLLPNGNLLLAGITQDYGGIFEVDQKGRTVWEAILMSGTINLTSATIQRIALYANFIRVGFDQQRPPELDVLKSLDYQLARLRSNNSKMRERGFQILCQMGPKAAPAIPVLMQMIKANDSLTRDAILTLVKLGPATVPHLEALLKHPNPEVRRLSMSIFKNNWPKAKPRLGQVVDALSDEHAVVRDSAVEALIHVRRDAKQVLPRVVEHLTRALEDKNPQVRRYAIYSLTTIGADAKSALTRLLQMLRDQAFAVRAAAVDALVAIAPTDRTVIAALIKELEDDELKFEACKALGNIGRAARDAIPILEKRLKDDNIEFRACVTDTLQKIRQSDK